MSQNSSRWSWWLTGLVASSVLKRKAEQAASRRRWRQQRVALIVSATGGLGDAGTSLTDHLLRNKHTSSTAPQTNPPWKVYCLRMSQSQNPPAHRDDNSTVVTYIQCDISNPDDVHKHVSSIPDITHFFYVGWTDRAGESENCAENNTDEFRNVLRTVMAVSPTLKHVGLQISRTHCSGACRKLSFTTSTAVRGLPPIDEEEDEDEMSLRVEYSMEDVLVEEIGKKKTSVKWSVHHPTTTPMMSESRAVAAGTNNGDDLEFREEGSSASSLVLWNEKLKQRAVVVTALAADTTVQC